MTEKDLTPSLPSSIHDPGGLVQFGEDMVDNFKRFAEQKIQSAEAGKP